MIITIDGLVATGKSTVAKRLAEFLGFLYVDTGAMYRAATYYVLQKDVDPTDPEAIEAALPHLDLQIRYCRNRQLCVVNGEDVTEHLRTPEVTRWVSDVSAVPKVREKLIAIQREWAKGVNAVFEGRDMAQVFSSAEIKVFLTGSLRVRAERRLAEVLRSGHVQPGQLSIEEVMEQTKERDERDSTRETAPLRRDPEAAVIDTTDLGVDEVVMSILESRDSKVRPQPKRE